MTIPGFSTIAPTLQRPVSESRSRSTPRASAEDDAAARAQRDQGRTRVEESDRDAADATDATRAGQEFFAALEAALDSAATPTVPTAVPEAAATADGVGLPGLATPPRGALFTVLSGAASAATGQALAGDAAQAGVLASTLLAGTTATEAATALAATAQPTTPGTVLPTLPNTGDAGATGTDPAIGLGLMAGDQAGHLGQGQNGTLSGQPGQPDQSGQPGQPGQPGQLSAASLASQKVGPEDGALSAAADLVTSAAPASTTPATPIGASAPTAATAAPAETKAPTANEALTRQVFPEISRFTQTAAPGTHRLAITLNPESLGEVKVTMIVRAGTLQVQLSADTPAARAALASGSSELHRMLEFASSSDTRIVVRDASGASTETRTGSGNSTPDQHLSDHRSGQHADSRNPTPESAEDWARGWSGQGREPAPAPRTTPSDPAAPGPLATTNPGRLDRLM